MALSGSNMTAAPLVEFAGSLSRGRHAVSRAALRATGRSPRRASGHPVVLRHTAAQPSPHLPASVYEEGIVFAGRAGRSVCWITEPSLIKTVLLDKHDTFRRTPITQRILGPLLGKGVLTAEGADWKWQRQTAAPVFRHHDLLGFVPTIVDATESLLARWRAAPAGAVRRSTAT